MPDVSTGLTTCAMLDATPPSLRVTGIGWFSGFRRGDPQSGLQLGDRIVAVNGEALKREPTPAEAQRAIGSYGEATCWADAGLDEGASITLTVMRRITPGQGWRTLDVTGTLHATPNVRTADNRILIGPGGPPEMYENDGFDRAWGQWAELIAKTASKVLDDPLDALSLTSTYELSNLMAQQPRAQLLAQKYPGPFADAVQQDFDAMLARLQGPAIDLPEGAMAYRELGEQRADEIRQQAQAGWTAIQAELAGQSITPIFPAEHPIHGQRAAIVGRYVTLPPLRNRDWVGEAGRTWFVAGNPHDNWYFADAESEEAVWMMDALARYRRLVMPNIDERYELIGQVQAQPGQLVVGERAHFGLNLKPVAALIGGAVFVDLRQPDRTSGRGIARFAGEEALRDQSGGAPPVTASPTEVLEAMVQALKAADQDLWISLFATWAVRTLPDGRPMFKANAVEQPARYFEEARRRIMERVHDMRPVWVDDVRVIFPGDAYPGQLRLEEVTVEMQHIGKIDQVYRPFSDVTVNRWWKLQRMGQPGAMGPWRITSLQAI
jgi:hypothetical protein